MVKNKKKWNIMKICIINLYNYGHEFTIVQYNRVNFNKLSKNTIKNKIKFC